MSRLIDADALERDGWRMSRTVQIDEKTMELQTRKPTDFPTIEPERIRGKWLELDISDAQVGEWQSMKCSVCGRYHTTPYMYYPTRYAYCPHCGADMRETDGSED